MEAFFTMATNVLMFIALAVPGYILAKTGLVKDSESTPLSRILIYVGVPFLVAYNVMDITFDSHACVGNEFRRFKRHDRNRARFFRYRRKIFRCGHNFRLSFYKEDYKSG